MLSVLFSPLLLVRKNLGVSGVDDALQRHHRAENHVVEHQDEPDQTTTCFVTTKEQTMVFNILKKRPNHEILVKNNDLLSNDHMSI